MRSFPSLILCAATPSGCANLCDQLGSSTPAAPIVRVEETVEYEARRAGVGEGELVEGALRAEGTRLAAVESEADVIVDVDLHPIDPGVGGWAGMIRLAVHEPATLRNSRQGVWATTASTSLVFTVRKAELREYVRGVVTDAPKRLLDSHPQLQAS